MEFYDSVRDLEEFALTYINSHEHPDDYHNFTLYKCISCGEPGFRLAVEHHTGSENWNFRGIIWGECVSCGYLMRLFTFTGQSRHWIKEERPECECGNRSFLTGQCERYEGEKGIPGFFDEGVIAGKCIKCKRKMVIAYTD